MISRPCRVSFVLGFFAAGLVAAAIAASSIGCQPAPTNTAAEPKPPITPPSTLHADHPPPPRQPVP